AATRVDGSTATSTFGFPLSEALPSAASCPASPAGSTWKPPHSQRSSTSGSNRSLHEHAVAFQLIDVAVGETEHFAQHLAIVLPLPRRAAGGADCRRREPERRAGQA